MSILAKNSAKLKMCKELLDGNLNLTLSKKIFAALDLAHSDICSMADKTLSGCSYFVTFIDEHS